MFWPVGHFRRNTGQLSAMRDPRLHPFHDFMEQLTKHT